MPAKRNRTFIILAVLLGFWMLVLPGVANAQSGPDDCDTTNGGFYKAAGTNMAETAQRKAALTSEYYYLDPTIDAKLSQCFEIIKNAITMLSGFNIQSVIGAAALAAIQAILEGLITQVCSGVSNIAAQFTRFGANLLCLPLPNLSVGFGFTLPSLGNCSGGVPLVSVGGGFGGGPGTSPPPTIWQVWGRP
ncbi:MAG: hypothetical protein SFW62_03210 [Alphaproteobacteria bacterium]|nr:hypothetical protein [Alphaproteobacteria bacterium]